MKKELMFGTATDKERLLVSPKNHELVSSYVGTTINFEKIFKITEVPTIDTDTGKESMYDTAVGVTTDGKMIAIPNKVAINSIVNFIETMYDEGLIVKTLSVIPKEIKSSSGNKYIDFEIVDFTI